MHRVRRDERCSGTSTSFNATSDTGAQRSNKATWNRTDSWHHHAGAESIRASGNTANKSDYTAGKYGHTASDSIANATGRYSTRWIYRSDARACDSTVPGEAAPARSESATIGCR